ncbi:hypothetical protein Purlil1_14081 [Purpureocillium lilacinum]|uniref:Uncharacterized protein n=1 Tax=Purpureocillium lilacinum TaxID=33203 RepID=A0ABR0BCB8_PURLI|nr:hypothetical protein Purlil1_14081 [Purpureocillium lilacinum]
MERKRSHETEASKTMGNSPVSSHGTPPTTATSRRKSLRRKGPVRLIMQLPSAQHRRPRAPKTPTTWPPPKALPNPRDHTTDQLNNFESDPKGLRTAHRASSRVADSIGSANV